MKGCDAAVVRSLERDLRASLLAWGMPEPSVRGRVGDDDALQKKVDTKVRQLALDIT